MHDNASPIVRFHCCTVRATTLGRLAPTIITFPGLSPGASHSRASACGYQTHNPRIHSWVCGPGRACMLAPTVHHFVSHHVPRALPGASNPWVDTLVRSPGFQPYVMQSRVDARWSRAFTGYEVHMFRSCLARTDGLPKTLHRRRTGDVFVLTRRR